jgi:hypothetical protein
MPFLLISSQQSCDGFMSRPNAYHCHLPTGRDLYFSLPFESHWLTSLCPQELACLEKQLYELIPLETELMMAEPNVENVMKTVRVIYHIFRQRKMLPESFVATWEN